MNLNNIVLTIKCIQDRYILAKVSNNITEMQNIRDDLAWEMFHFGEIYSQIKSDYELADDKYKTCLNQEYLSLKEGKSRTEMTGEIAERRSFVNCGEIRDVMQAKRELYNRARTILERVDQIMNSIASRIGLFKKIE